MSRPPSIPLSYLLNQLIEEKWVKRLIQPEDDDLENFPFGLDPSVIRKARFLLMYDEDHQRERAFLYTTLFKTKQVKGVTWVATNTRKDAQYLQQYFNQLIPRVARLDMFKHRNPPELEHAPIIISTYERLMNRYLERRLAGVKTIMLHDLDAQPRNFHVKDALTTLFVRDKKQRFNIIMSLTRKLIEFELEIPLRMLKILQPSELHDAKYRLLKHHEFILTNNVKKEGMHTLKEFEERFDVAYFILVACYRRARRKKDLMTLLTTSLLGIRYHCFKGPRKTREIIEKELDFHLKALLQDVEGISLLTQLNGYYKTTEWGKALVRHGLVIREHKKILSVILSYKNTIEPHIEMLEAWEGYKEFWVDLMGLGVSLDDEYLKTVVERIYLKLLFELPEEELEIE
ncbi:MAG: hypothetical protein ACTSXU_11590 [Promethearchaeota archaeon]